MDPLGSGNVFRNGPQASNCEGKTTEYIKILPKPETEAIFVPGCPSIPSVFLDNIKKEVEPIEMMIDDPILDKKCQEAEPKTKLRNIEACSSYPHSDNVVAGIKIENETSDEDMTEDEQTDGDANKCFIKQEEPDMFPKQDDTASDDSSNSALGCEPTQMLDEANNATKAPSKIRQRYKCTVCPFRSPYEKDLRLHLGFHGDSSKIAKHQCLECGFETYWKSAFRRHMLRHKKPEEVKMYKCAECDFQTLQKSHLNTHALRHKAPQEVCFVKMPKNKKFLTLYEKSKIIEDYQQGLKITILAKKYGIAKSTVCSIIKKKDKIRMTVVNQSDKPGKNKKCTLKNGKYPKMEIDLHKWVVGQRELNLPVTGEMLKQKALQLHESFKNDNETFNASDGWLQKFKVRYGVRLLKMSGEKLSSASDNVSPFKGEFLELIKTHKLIHHQIYNADETGLYWKMLPDKTAPGLKQSKQRITFLGCANATGSHKLTPLIIGQAKSPRCFQNFNNPCIYKNNKNAWMTQEIFKSWFFESFVPEVKAFLKSQKLPEKAVLLLDNAASHPVELKTEDGAIFVMFMPSNVRSPMEQNALRLTKLYYRKNLLSYVVAKGENIGEALKSLTMKNAIVYLNRAWQQLDASIIQKCWNNIISENDIDEGDLPVATIQEQLISQNPEHTVEETIQLLQILVGPGEYNNKDIEKWNEDLEDVTATSENNAESLIYTDTEDNESEAEVEEPKKVSVTEVLAALRVVSQWSEENNVSVSDIESLRNIEDRAVAIHWSA